MTVIALILIPLTTVQQDAIQACQSNSDAPSGVFRVDGTAACFKDKNVDLNNISLPTNDAGDVNKEDIIVTELKDGDTSKRITVDTAKMVNGNLEITFDEEKTYTKAASHLVESSRQSSRIIIATSCDSGGTTNKKYDYSQLGETWSTQEYLESLPQVEIATWTTIHM